jgi:thiol-disulfide isomerase/thioredoxin
MLERTLFALGLITLSIYGWWWLNQRSLAHLRAVQTTHPIDPLLSGLQTGIPTVIYFTMPDCHPCRTQQTPALSALADELGHSRLQIIQVDATLDPLASERWEVFSVPTTFILDSQFRPQRVNRGVTTTQTLKQQIAELYPNHANSAVGAA